MSPSPGPFQSWLYQARREIYETRFAPNKPSKTQVVILSLTLRASSRASQKIWKRMSPGGYCSCGPSHSTEAVIFSLCLWEPQEKDGVGSGHISVPGGIPGHLGSPGKWRQPSRLSYLVTWLQWKQFSLSLLLMPWPVQDLAPPLVSVICASLGSLPPGRNCNQDPWETDKS